MADSRPDHAEAAAPGSGPHSISRAPFPRKADFPIVGIGASAGGLDACRKFLGALPANGGMAFILVQHLDPTHESMMVELLAGHTPMVVQQATDGMPIERDHLYVIPPAAYLAVADGAMWLSRPLARHGAPLPFDFLLNSLAADRGALTGCVILSGTGADGSLGLQAVKDHGGLVLVQDPDEAGHSGMPSNAIMTGAVDLVLPVADIPAALRRIGADATDAQNLPLDRLAQIIELLRTRTAHDFTLYKPGTLQRRIERRMAMAAIETRDADRQAELAALCQRMVLETYAPAAVLINRKHECLYSLGPTDRYLRVAPGHPSHDLLAMARRGVRTRLRSAIQQASEAGARVVIAGGRTEEANHSGSFSIAVQPVQAENEDLLLVCFVDDARIDTVQVRRGARGDQPRVAALEQALEVTRTELQGAIHNLEVSGEEQKAINEEALSVQEEYQSTNEELLTSKEELQSLNEELTALNSQLQETLERQRTTANDLQNVLYSTDVATLFLDRHLNIRFFTPATRALFAIIPGDLGRPLADLHSLAADADLLDDARIVLRTPEPIEREIEAQNGACFIRRVLPYRTQDNGVEGVVITFADVTDRRHVLDELGMAKRQAELATAAKSRFLAAASHDLRQPLQTLALVQGLLAKNVESEKARKLVGRLDETLGAMSGMLNALLDINQIEAGTVHAEIVGFPVSDLLEQLRDEFIYHAQAKGLVLHVVPCSLSISSDPGLLEQMLRNLLSNALKYTRSGKVLLGCRRHRDVLRIEVWDTGIGIPDNALQAIFEEYHQLDNPARERSRGLGLGLSIVHHLGALLGHPIHVHSRPGKGSVFSVDVPRQPGLPVARQGLFPTRAGGTEPVRHTGSILVIEDDPDVRELLEVVLIDEGHLVVAASDGVRALELVKQGLAQPDLILADYNLPTGMDGVRTTAMLRQALHRLVPAIILTGDISTGTQHNIDLEGCERLSKPMRPKELSKAIQRLLPQSRGPFRARPSRAPETPGGSGPPVIFIVDDDDAIRGAIRAVLEDDGRTVEDFATCEGFLAAYRPGREACLVIDAYLPGMNGLALLGRLHDAGHRLPAIMITGSSDVPMAVQAMKAGASDFIEKPISRNELLASVDLALEQSRDASKLSAWRADAATHVAGLTPRQRQIMDMVLAGHASKNIAADLGISQRTVENHRASIMTKMGTRSLPALARLALAAAVRA